jgi:hypothetical protein
MPDEDPDLVKALDKMDEEYEPLLPIEKKLILWSIIIGVVALAVLVFLSHTYFET